MNKPRVTVIACTQFFGVPEELADGGIRADQDQGSDGARLVECAGRCCYDSYGKGRPSASYHDHVREVGHGSVTEHVQITFYIDGVSRGLTHEHVRHRHASISQRSTRYVDESTGPWVFHPLMAKYCGDKTWGRITRLVFDARDLYRQTVLEIETGLLQDGIDKATARKQARGAARGLLGNALGSAMVWSANIRSLRNYLLLRAHPAADAEIRLLANAIYEAAFATVPEWFNDFRRVPVADGIGYALETDYPKV